MGVEEFEGVRKREIVRAQIDSVSVGDIMTSDFESVDPEMELYDIIAAMRASNLHEIPVCQGKGELLGVISLGRLIQRKNLAVGAKARSVMDNASDVSVDTPITEVSEIFMSSGFRQLPVTADGRVLGIVSRSDVVGRMPKVGELRNLHVGDIMTEEVVTVSNDSDVEDALTLMRDLEIRSIPVVESGSVVGMLGVKDVMNYSWRKPERQTIGELVGRNNPVSLKVHSVSVDNVYSVSPETKLEDASVLMRERAVSSLPVVDEGNLLGIVTKYDVLELFASFVERDMVFVQITGLDDNDRDYLLDMEDEVQRYLKNIARISRPRMFDLHVTKYNNTGNRAKYSLNARMLAGRHVYRAKAVDWGLIEATDVLMDRLEMMVKEKKEEVIDLRKRKGR